MDQLANIVSECVVGILPINIVPYSMEWIYVIVLRSKKQKGEPTMQEEAKQSKEVQDQRLFETDKGEQTWRNLVWWRRT